MMKFKTDFLPLTILSLIIFSVLVSILLYSNIVKIKEGFDAVTNLHTKLEQLDIDSVIYINLDTRPDRNEEILSELNQININMDKVHRLSAVKRKWGALGCSLSHIACMKTILEKGWKRTLVLEDDAGFEAKDVERWNAGVIDINAKIKSDNYDVIFLGGFVRDPNGPLKTDLTTIYQTKNTSCTHAYVIKHEYAQKLLEHTETAVQMMMKDAPNVKQFNLDNAWSAMMARDRWFISIPTLAYQRESFSDIEGKAANGDAPLRGEVVRAWKAGTVLK
jgi:glycosyl transferase family 25